MGILTGGTSTGLTGKGLLGLGSNKSVRSPDYVQNDFPDGLEIVELVNGREMEADRILLLGSFMPKAPFAFGGTQQIVKEYYAGSTEPTVQVMGPRESDVSIQGRLWTKHLRGSSKDDNDQIRDSVINYQELIDAMRIRGNLVRITMGEWRRYGFIAESKFSLKRLHDIDYEIRFEIVGFNPPKGCRFTSPDTDPIKPNKDLTAMVEKLLEAQKSMPSSMPQSLSDSLNNLIGGVADVVHGVTSFVDSVVGDAEALVNSANRALGMIKYARAYISKTQRQIGSMLLTVTSLGSAFPTESKKTSAAVNNMHYIHNLRENNYNLQAYLAQLQTKFAALAATVPQYRYMVVQGDTLQKISMKFYNSADHWDLIMKHNKLTSTALTKGQILEIPKL